MRRGFIFDAGKCVGCQACSAACRLKNNFTQRTRIIHTWNEDLIPGIPVFHLSIACNHCEEADCMKGCPSGAYRRERNAIVVNPGRCTGCRYCIWNCPYDAPQLTERGVIEKCHFCYVELESGENPACANACPTGALSFGELPEPGTLPPAWFPSVAMKPALEIKGINDLRPTEVITRSVFSPYSEASTERTRFIEWSLVAFTFITMVLASLVSASMFTGKILRVEQVAVMLVSAGGLSLFHLGKPSSFWRAVMNPLNSPLAREVILFTLFSALAVASSLTMVPLLNASAALAGIVLMISIDMVYMMPERKRSVRIGQVFPGFLLLTAYLAGNIPAFTVIAVMKLISTGKIMTGRNVTEENMFLLFTAVAFLTIAWTGLITGIVNAGPVITGLILAAELAERIFFYKNFSPGNIRKSMSEQFNRIKNEKEGS